MTPHTSSSPESHSEKQSAAKGALLALAVVILVVGALVGVATFAARAAALTVAAEMEKARLDADQRSEALLAAVKGIGPMQPPSNDKLFTVVVKGLGYAENVVATGMIGTTPGAAFATDLTTAQQTDAYTQEIVVTNRATTNSLCFKPIPWNSAGGATCALKCAAATITCPASNGAGTTATDGTYTAPGTAWPRRYDGTSCICIVGSAASTAYQTERVIR